MYTCIAKGVDDRIQTKGTTMSSVTSSWRQRRQAARTRRALDQALARTSSPAMRDELLTLANSSDLLGR